MQSFANADGLAFSATRPESLEAYDAIIRAFLGFRRDTADKVKALVEADPEMPMAIAARGYLTKMVGTSESAPTVRAMSDKLNAMAAAARLNPREALHAKALTAWADNQMEEAATLWGTILHAQPNDTLALRLAHFIDFYSGNGRRLRDGIARVLHAYPKGHRFHGFVQGMYAFGLEEAGDYARAERHGKIAVDENPADAWSVHAVAHAMEMTGRDDEGLAFTGAIEKSWNETNNFRFHLHWHRGLYLLEKGRTEEVLALYDAEFGAEPDSGFYLDMLNATSMLWRLELFGMDVGDRWQKLAEVAAKRHHDEELIFVSLHYMMALVSAGGDADVRALMDHLETWAEKQTTQGQVVARVGLEIARALADMRGGRAREAYDRLVPIRYEIDPIGGSHAQRDVFQMLLIDAAMRAGETGAATAFLAERVAERPGGVWGWRRYADVLSARGADAAAAEARIREQEAAGAA
ncbi:MAG: tetratricopeptide repeat protein [Pseudomonadota bacterium]